MFRHPFFVKLKKMELKEIYKDGNSIITLKDFGSIRIENDKAKFPLYKKLKLDVFKSKNDKTDKKRK